MNDARFGGGAAGLLQRLRPAPISVADLRDAAEDVLPGLATTRLRVAVLDDRVDGPLVVLEEDERRVRMPLRDLAEDMTDACVPPTAEGLRAALRRWIAARPVPDAAAAAAGVAVLDWTDAAQTAVGWRVVLRRGEVAVPWTPSAPADRRRIHCTRAAAAQRAGAVDGVLRVEGPVALWSHPEVPLLATAVLVAPRRLFSRIALAGLEIADMHVVVSPRHPVACAGEGVAARLTGESGEPCVRLPWQRLAQLPWS